MKKLLGISIIFLILVFGQTAKATCIIFPSFECAEPQCPGLSIDYYATVQQIYSFVIDRVNAAGITPTYSNYPYPSTADTLFICFHYIRTTSCSQKIEDMEVYIKPLWPGTTGPHDPWAAHLLSNTSNTTVYDNCAIDPPTVRAYREFSGCDGNSSDYTIEFQAVSEVGPNMTFLLERDGGSRWILEYEGPNDSKTVSVSGNTQNYRLRGTNSSGPGPWHLFSISNGCGEVGPTPTNPPTRID